MKETGITKGEWEAKGIHIKLKGKSRGIGQAYLMNFKHDQRGKSVEDKEGLANANLIADAGNTTNKCGLLPSELLEQRDELLSMLRKSFHLLIDSGESEYGDLLEMKNLINKVKDSK